MQLRLVVGAATCSHLQVVDGRQPQPSVRYSPSNSSPLPRPGFSLVGWSQALRARQLAGQVLAPGRFTFHLSVGRFKVVRHSAAGLAVAKITEEIPSRRNAFYCAGSKTCGGQFHSALIRSTVGGQNPGVKKCHSGVKNVINYMGSTLGENGFPRHPISRRSVVSDISRYSEMNSKNALSG